MKAYGLIESKHHLDRNYGHMDASECVDSGAPSRHHRLRRRKETRRRIRKAARRAAQREILKLL